MEIIKDIEIIYDIGIILFDALVVLLIIFWIYRVTRGTSAIPILLGLLAIFLAWLVAEFLGMYMMGMLLNQFVNVGFIAIIILFQNEIRQFLFSIGDKAKIKGPSKILEKVMTLRHKKKPCSRSKK